MRETWGEPPSNATTLPEWATHQAERHAEADARVTDAAQRVDAVRADRDAMRQRHEQKHRALPVSEHGAEQARRNHLGMRIVSPHRQAREASSRAVMLRAEADELRDLPVNDAARLIETKRAARENQRQQAAERARQLNDPFTREQRHSDPRDDGPTRGF